MSSVRRSLQARCLEVPMPEQIFDEDGSPLEEITPPNIDDVMAAAELTEAGARKVVEHFRAQRQNWNFKKAKERKKKDGGD